MSTPSPNNCMRSSEQYWLTNPLELINYYNIFPSNQMGSVPKINSIMRLSVIIFIVLLVMGYEYAITFILCAIILNIFFYLYYYRN